MRKSGIVVVGSLNADLTIYTERLPQPGETVHGNGFAVNPGGKSANQAVAASKLGGNVTLIGVDANGENSIIISAGANGTLAPADVDFAAFRDAAVVCLCLEVGIDTVVAAAQAGHDAGATVLLNLSPYAEVPELLAGLSDVLLVNAHEAALFLGSEASIPDADAEAEAWEPVRRQFADRGLPRVLVTLGSQGSVVLDSLADGGQLARIAPTRVSAVDTTGAGDAFTGAVAARLAAGDSLVEAASFASVAAALAATKKGTQAAYATLEEVEAARAS